MKDDKDDDKCTLKYKYIEISWNFTRENASCYSKFQKGMSTKNIIQEIFMILFLTFPLRFSFDHEAN